MKTLFLFSHIAYLNDEKMINVMTSSSTFLKGSKLEKHSYTDTSIPYIPFSIGNDIRNVDNEVLKAALRLLVETHANYLFLQSDRLLRSNSGISRPMTTLQTL
jgi:hypothetical protein